jgi:hypothetical protein
VQLADDLGKLLDRAARLSDVVPSFSTPVKSPIVAQLLSPVAPGSSPLAGPHSPSFSITDSDDDDSDLDSNSSSSPPPVKAAEFDSQTSTEEDHQPAPVDAKVPPTTALTVDTQAEWAAVADVSPRSPVESASRTVRPRGSV